VTEPIKPTICRSVHYVSYGTPSGEYHPKCRAAVIVEVGQWVTVQIDTPKSFDRSEGRPIRMVEQWWYADACALTVLNPTGLFFNGAAGVVCEHDEGTGSESTRTHRPGAWHWPERV
jgi:hypothetical protein